MKLSKAQARYLRCLVDGTNINEHLPTRSHWGGLMNTIASLQRRTFIVWSTSKGKEVITESGRKALEEYENKS